MERLYCYGRLQVVCSLAKTLRVTSVTTSSTTLDYCLGFYTLYIDSLHIVHVIRDRKRFISGIVIPRNEARATLHTRVLHVCAQQTRASLIIVIC